MIGHMLWSLSTELDETTPWHAHAVYEFLLCHDDAGHLVGADVELPFRRGRTLLIPPDTSHRIVLRPGEVTRVKAMCLTATDVATQLAPVQGALLADMCAGGISVADHDGTGVDIETLGNLVVDGLGTDDVERRHVNWGALGLILALHGRERRVEREQASDRYRAKMDEIVAWVDESADAEITIDRTAERFALSRSLLTREFRRHTGKSFVDYLNARRLERAAVSLVTARTSVTDAALKNGFSNLSHFHRLFKNRYGLSPAAFRRKVIEDGGV